MPTLDEIQYQINQYPCKVKPDDESMPLRLLNIIAGLAEEIALLKHKVENNERMVKQAANTASCLANGIIPD